MLLSTTTRCIGPRNQLDPFFAFLEKAVESGFRHVNLAFGELTELLTEDFDTAAFAKRLRSYGLSVNGAHAPLFYPFLFHETDGKAWQGVMLRAMRIAAACGVTDFVMHLGTVVDGEMRYQPAASAEQNIAYLQPYLEQAEQLGLRIDVENGTNQPWDGEDARPLKSVSPGIEELITVTDAVNSTFSKGVCGICFDCGHANLAGLDLPKAIKKIGNRLKVVHVHDNDGSADQHLLPFAGNISWPLVIDALKEIDFRGELALELYYENGELKEDPVAYLTHTYSILKEQLNEGGVFHGDRR